MKATMSEEEEQKALVNWLKVNKIDFFSIPNENLFTTLLKQHLPKSLHHLIFVIEKRLVAMGKKKGASDIVVFLDNVILFVEMKRQKGGTLSKEQKLFMEMANKYKYAESYRANGWLEAKDIISARM